MNYLIKLYLIFCLDANRQSEGLRKKNHLPEVDRRPGRPAHMKTP